jgi:hypothetical protein
LKGIQGHNDRRQTQAFDNEAKGLSNIFIKYWDGDDRPLQQFYKYQTRTVNIKQFLLQRDQFFLPFFI